MNASSSNSTARVAEVVALLSALSPSTLPSPYHYAFQVFHQVESSSVADDELIGGGRAWSFPMLTRLYQVQIFVLHERDLTLQWETICKMSSVLDAVAYLPYETPSLGRSSFMFHLRALHSLPIFPEHLMIVLLTFF